MKSLKKIKQILKRNKWLVVLAFLLSVFMAPQVYAETGIVEGTVNLVTNGIWVLLLSVLQTILQALGAFLSMMISFLGSVLQYNAFRTSEEVIIGWQIVRDTINSFFIVVLIAIAISTIIRWKPFDFRTALPRFVIAAIIVNFSRTICLIAISFSQVIMRTFANELTGALPAFVIGLRAPAAVALSGASLGSLATGEVSKPAIEWATLLVSQIFAVIMVSLTIAAIFFFVALLIIRILVLWILMILSPMAFFLWGIPGKGQSYFDRWKDEFIKQILVGPVIAFFLYIILLFFTRNATTNYGFVISGNSSALANVLSSPRQLFSYIVSFALMMVALEVIKEIGAKGTGAALGLTKKAASLVGKTLQTADKLAYGANIPFLPTLYGTQQTFKSIGSALSARTESAIERGKASRLKEAKALEGGPAGLLSLVKAAAAGDAETLKSLSLVSGESSLLRRALPRVGTAAKTDKQIDARYSQLAKRKEAIAFGENASNAVLNTSYKGIPQELTRLTNTIAQNGTDKSQIESDLAAKRNRIAELQNIAAGNVQGVRLGARGRQELQNLQSEVQTGEQDVRALDASSTALEAQKTELEKAKDFIEKSGAVNANGTIGDNFAAYKRSADADQKEAETLVTAARDRSIRQQVAGSGFKKEMRKKEQEYYNTAFTKEEKVAVDALAADVQSNFNAQNIPEMQAGLLKSAEQGALDNVMLKLNPEYTMDEKGIGKFMSDLETKVGMTNDEIGELMNRLQGRNWADRKAVQAAFVERTPTGTWKQLTGEKRTTTIRKNVENNIRQVLIKGQHDAIGVKKDGKYEMDASALKAFQNRIGEVENVLKDDRASLSTDTLKMIKAKVDSGELAIAPGSEAMRGLTKKLGTA